MARITKYEYLKVLQEKIEGKWEDSIWFRANDAEDMKELKSDLKAYRAEGCIVRVVNRRELNPLYSKENFNACFAE